MALVIVDCASSLSDMVGNLKLFTGETFSFISSDSGTFSLQLRCLVGVPIGEAYIEFCTVVAADESDLSLEFLSGLSGSLIAHVDSIVVSLSLVEGRLMLTCPFCCCWLEVERLPVECFKSLLPTLSSVLVALGLFTRSNIWPWACLSLTTFGDVGGKFDKFELNESLFPVV